MSVEMLWVEPENLELEGGEAEAMIGDRSLQEVELGLEFGDLRSEELITENLVMNRLEPCRENTGKLLKDKHMQKELNLRRFT